MSKWATKDGSIVEVKDMSNTHLLNTINFLKRIAVGKCATNDLFYVMCPVLQGDMAQYYFEQEQNAAWDMTWKDYVPEIYWEMKAEAVGRGLDVEDEE